MKLTGAIVQYDDASGMVQTVCFNDIHKVASLKDKPVRLRYCMRDFTFEPGVAVLLPDMFIQWLLTDMASPFNKSKDLYVDREDKGIDVATIEAARAKIRKETEPPAATIEVPDEYPDKATWHPNMLLKAFDFYGVNDIDKGQFMTTLRPPAKGLHIARWMRKHNRTPKELAAHLQPS